MEESRACGFDRVLSAELEELSASRQRRGQSAPVSTDEAIDPIERAHRANLFGLAFSGGGIRSATFNLGVLQTLARLRILPAVDYLSTVSGGGYIGGWLHAWIKRRGFEHALFNLHPERSNRRDHYEPGEIHFLRNYSNYLTPRRGLFSGDTWALVTGYMRNLTLNLTILALAIAAILIVPWLSVLLFHYLAAVTVELPSIQALMRSVFLLLSLSVLVVSLNLVNPPTVGGAAGKRPPRRFSPFAIRTGAALPVLLAAWLLSVGLWAARDTPWSEWDRWAKYTGGFYMLLWLFASVVTWAVTRAEFRRLELRSLGARLHRLGSSVKAFSKDWREQGERAGLRLFSLVWIVSMTLFAGALAGPLLLAIAGLMSQWQHTPGVEWHAPSWGAPLVVLVFALSAVAHIGLVGRAFSEEAREWWSRLGATVLLWNLIFALLFLIAIYGPMLIDRLNEWLTRALGAGWLLTSIAGAVLGKGGSTTLQKPGARRVILYIAPYVFIAGLLILVAHLLHLCLPAIVLTVQERLDAPPTLLLSAGTSINEAVAYWTHLDETLGPGLWVAFAAAALLALAISWRVGVNEFSLHATYRNRLVRCYLGATNSERRPHPFTGFDPNDDRVKVSDLKSKDGFVGPYPIINTALNLVRGDQLAWQRRKAASLVFTPRFSGYNFSPRDRASLDQDRRLEDYAYRPTADFGGGVTLGTAMAISGAAASPNMGYHSSVPLAFLMTVFNIRLGWWLGNPRHEDTWTNSGPTFGLFYLASELLGITNNRSRYVYVSDGGHFDNLGVYELVRRRCRYILVSDAGADRAFHFSDLGMAIEKCRADFGVDIDIRTTPLHPQPDNGFSRWHCAIGVIRYNQVDRDAPDGYLIYLKPSLSGDEPADVLNYRAEHPDFPHEPTTDQWFDETQFESYRALGQHVAESVLAAAVAEGERTTIDALFAALRRQWYSPSEPSAAAFSKHAAKLDGLIRELRSSPALRFLDAQMYPMLHRLAANHQDELAAGGPIPPESYFPKSYDELRAGFLMCKQMLRFMEGVYQDLDLEHEFDNPDIRGWINLFRRWSWSRMFKFAWTVTAPTYSARFQTFCEERLGLAIGRVDIGAVAIGRFPDDFAQETRARKFWETADADFGFTYYDRRLLTSFILAHSEGTGHPIGDYEVYPVRVIVEDPLAKDQEFFFYAGFVVTGWLGYRASAGRRAIFYLRIYPEFRRAALGHRAVRSLFRDPRFADYPLQLSPPEADGRPRDLSGSIAWFRGLFKSVGALEIPEERELIRFVQLCERERAQSRAQIQPVAAAPPPASPAEPKKRRSRRRR